MSPLPKLGAQAALILGLACSQAWAVPSKAPPADLIRKEIERDLGLRKTTSFESLLKTWQERHGRNAVDPLIRIASDRKAPDSDRYIAIMGAAKLGGRSLSPTVIPLLQDKSWMVRNGALRALVALRDPESSKAVLPLLQDPALVVRSEAVRAVRVLRPEGSVDSLVQALRHPSNYHHGKALWVPFEVLDTLVAMNAKEAAPRLKPLLRHDRDPRLQQETLGALKALTGKDPSPKGSLKDQAKAWEKAI